MEAYREGLGWVAIGRRLGIHEKYAYDLIRGGNAEKSRAYRARRRAA
jgi:hypothetical protein